MSSMPHEDALDGVPLEFQRRGIEVLLQVCLPLAGWGMAQDWHGIMSAAEDPQWRVRNQGGNRRFQHPLHGVWKMDGDWRTATPEAATGAVALRMRTLQKHIPSQIRCHPGWKSIEAYTLGDYERAGLRALSKLGSLPSVEHSDSLLDGIRYEHPFIRGAYAIELPSSRATLLQLVRCILIAEGMLLEYRWRSGLLNPHPSLRFEFGAKSIFGTPGDTRASFSSITLWKGEAEVQHPTLGRWLLWGNSCRAHRLPIDPVGPLAVLHEKVKELLPGGLGLSGLDEQEHHRVAILCIRKIHPDSAATVPN